MASNNPPRAVARRDERVNAPTSAPSAAYLEDTLAQAELGIIIRSLDGAAVWVNRSVCRMLGYAEDELLSLPMAELLGATEDENARARGAALLAGGDPGTFEVDYIRADGGILEARGRASLIRNRDGEPRYFLSQIEDISETKQTRRELLRRIDLDATLTRMATEFINIATDEIDEGIVRVLATVSDFAGADRGTVFLHAPDERGFAPEYAWAAARLSPAEAEIPVLPEDVVAWSLEILRSGGMLRINDVTRAENISASGLELLSAYRARSLASVPILRGATLVGFLGLVADEPRDWDDESMTLVRVAGEMIRNALARKAADVTIAKHERLRQLVTKLATDFINVPPNGVDAGIRDSLPEIARFSDCDRMGVFVLDESGRSAHAIHDWVSPDVICTSANIESVETPPNTWSGRDLLAGRNFVLESADDIPPGESATRAWVKALKIGSAMGIPMRVSTGVIGWVGLATVERKVVWSPETVDLLEIAAQMLANALERKRIAEQADRHQEALAHALRVGTMGELASGLAHELNQPLAAISNYARGCERRLRSGELDKDELARVTMEISNLALHAGGVIRRIREHVRKGGAPRARHELDDLLKEVTGFLSSDFREHEIALLVEAGTKATVQVDAIQIEQVLLNLLRNAIESVAECDVDARRISISARPDGVDGVEVAVSDSGAGIDAASADRIFDQFYTTKAEGLGLGLAISRSIIEAHGGRLWLEPAAEGGASFRFTLPLAHDSARDD